MVFLNGSPTDNNATLFSAGAHSVIDATPTITNVGEQAVPDWDNDKAVTIFEQLYTAADGRVDGVYAANDGLAGSVISILEKNKRAGQVPVTGQDADRRGPAEHPRRNPVHDGLQVGHRRGQCAGGSGDRSLQG